LLASLEDQEFRLEAETPCRGFESVALVFKTGTTSVTSVASNDRVPRRAEDDLVVGLHAPFAGLRNVNVRSKRSTTSPNLSFTFESESDDGRLASFGIVYDTSPAGPVSARLFADPGSLAESWPGLNVIFRGVGNEASLKVNLEGREVNLEGVARVALPPRGRQTLSVTVNSNVPNVERLAANVGWSKTLVSALVTKNDQRLVAFRLEHLREDSKAKLAVSVLDVVDNFEAELSYQLQAGAGLGLEGRASLAGRPLAKMSGRVAVDRREKKWLVTLKMESDRNEIDFNGSGSLVYKPNVEFRLTSTFDSLQSLEFLHKMQRRDGNAMLSVSLSRLVRWQDGDAERREKGKNDSI